MSLHREPDRLSDDEAGRRGDGRSRVRRGRHARRLRRLKGFLVRKDGHVYAFAYPRGQEKAAVQALLECSGLERVDVLALVCYLGHDPRELGLD